MIISWGKPKIWIKKSGETSYTEIPTPIEDSTELSTEKGDKLEAKIEGGENEAVKFKASTFSLAFGLRFGAGRVMPINGADGVVDGEYELILQPEDPTAPGLKFDRSVVSYEDTYTAADGAQRNYQFDALKPSTGNQLKWGTVTVTDNTPTFVELA